MANSFLSIPQDLGIKILSGLDAVSLVRCAMTCKSMYETFKSSSLLAYIVELHFDGLKDTGSSIERGEGYSEIIKRLQHRRQAWISPDWTEFTTVRMKYKRGAYELIGNVFANADGQNLEIVLLPTASFAEVRRIERAMSGFTIRDLTMDPTQDVIMFLEEVGVPQTLPISDPRIIHIHIRTISNNETHQLAKQSPLQYSVPPNNLGSTSIFNIRLHIARNILALSFCTTKDMYFKLDLRMLIYDWTTSDLITDSSTSIDVPLRSLQCFSCSLLDSEFCFFTSLQNCGSIRLYKLLRFCAPESSLIHIASLHLPPTAVDTNITRFSAYRGPTDAHPSSDSGTPIVMNDDDCLHVFDMEYNYYHYLPHDIDGELLWETFTMFVHQRALMKYCRDRARTHEGSPLDIPWAEWGPKNASIIPHPTISDISDKWPRYVHGQRAITSRHFYGEPRVKILDFSLAAVLAAEESEDSLFSFPSSSPIESDPLGTLIPSSLIPTSEREPIFQDVVKTHLPYVLIEQELDRDGPPYTAYMINDDGFIGVNIMEDDTLRLDVFTV